MPHFRGKEADDEGNVEEEHARAIATAWLRAAIAIQLE